jgi:hypothetical protein
MTVTLAAPWAFLAALVGLVPIAAAALRSRTAKRLRRELGLAEPPVRARLARPIALACLFGLLGLAVTRPSIRAQHERTARTDAEVLVVLDSSRSMLASSRPGGESRFRRAVAFARLLHASLPQVPIGVSSLTNRLLPYLFPTSDDRAYNLVLDRAVGIERPPPSLSVDRWVTSFEPLNDVSARRYFSPTVHKRVLLVLSDAETHLFDATSVLRHLERTGTTPVVVRFWRPNERIYRRGRPIGNYRATQPDALLELQSAGWVTFREADWSAATTFVQERIGVGQTASVGYRRHELSLAPIVALAALAPLLLLLVPPGLRPLRVRRRLAEAEPAPARS